MPVYFHRDGSMEILSNDPITLHETMVLNKLLADDARDYNAAELFESSDNHNMEVVDTYAEAANTGSIDLNKLNPLELFDGKTVPEYLTLLRETVEELYNYGEPDSDILTIEQGMYIGAYNSDKLTDDQFDTRAKLEICGNRFQYR